MDRLARCAADSTDGKRFGDFFRITIVAFCFVLLIISQSVRVSHYRAHLLDHLHLTIESSCSALNQRHVGCQTHPIHIAPRVQIIQRIEHNVEAREPVDVELAILDVGMICFQLRARLKLVRHFFCNL